MQNCLFCDAGDDRIVGDACYSVHFEEALKDKSLMGAQPPVI